MPYGLPKPLDTPANNKKIEDCVEALMKDKNFKPKGKDDKKTAAIKVCKNQILKKASEITFNFPVRFEFADKKYPTKIHIIPVGEWDHSEYGKMVITADDIAEFVKNFQKKIRKDIPITEGHETRDEKPAIGWFKKLHNEGKKGLWATVEWTEEGKELLRQKKYKYFSPEFYRVYEDPETHQIYTNVLIGGALTNKPFFKGLKSVIFSEPSIINQFNAEHNMDLTKILAKEPGTLTDDEKKFLVSKFSELKKGDILKFAEDMEGVEAEKPAENDEGKEGEGKESENKEGDKGDKGGEGENKEGENKEGNKGKESDEGNKEGDKDGKKVEGSEQFVKVKASEYKALEDKANQGADAYTELQRTKIETVVDKMAFSEQNREGKILPKAKVDVIKFMLTLSETQKTEFIKIVDGLPGSQLFGETGDSGNEAVNIASKKLDTKVTELRKADENMSYADAVKQAFEENPQLEKAYNAEIESAA
ncbi:hypothetical protein KAU19_02865 [Candidatus Parcubacteria bacterium]|nr:hypothetical protein [Candidatus Parcubacteria bacterium]